MHNRQASNNYKTSGQDLAFLAPHRFTPFTMTDSNLFSDTFTLTEVSPLKYDRVTRLSANTENGETFLTLDVNSELFPAAVGDRLQLLLVSTLLLDGSKDDNKGWRDVGKGESSLADEYDYVCHGKVYRSEESGDENM